MKAEKAKLVKLAKKAKKAERAKKDEKTFQRYIAGSAAQAVAASKAIPVAERNKADCLFEVDMRVCGLWADDETGEGDEWCEGVVVSLDYVHRTVHIKYDDGDTDDAVPWYNARILDELPA